MIMEILVGILILVLIFIGSSIIYLAFSLKNWKEILKGIKEIMDKVIKGK